MRADIADDGGLEPAEREVVARLQHRSRERDRLGVAVDGHTVDGRAARVAQAEEASHLVERLAGGVVDRRAEHAVAPVVLHGDEHRVPAGHEEHDQRRDQRRLVEERGVEVGLEVVDAHERHVPDERERLGRADPHQERAHQARADGGRDRVDAGAVEAGLDERLGDDRREQLDVRAAGDLRHDAAEAGVEVDLARHDRGEHRRAVGDDRRGRLVTRRLDPEDAVDLSRLGSAPRFAGRGLAHWSPTSSVVVPVTSSSSESRRAAYSSVSTSSAHITRASSLLST